MGEAKCNTIQTCITNKQYDDLMKIFKKKYDLTEITIAEIYRRELIIPYIKKELNNEK